jgi:hypothetical protein
MLRRHGDEYVRAFIERLLTRIRNQTIRSSKPSIFEEEQLNMKHKEIFGVEMK